MRIVALACCAAALLASSFARAKDETPVAMRVKRQIALESLKRFAQEAFVSPTRTEDAGQVDALSRAMSAQPEVHRQKAASKEASRKRAAEAVRDSYQRQWSTALKRANAGLESPLSKDDLDKTVGDVEAMIAEAGKRFLDQEFSASYDHARVRSVAEQWDRLKLTVHPPSFDSVDRALRKEPRWEAHAASFRSQLAALRPANVTLFEENEAAFDQLVESVIVDVSQQIRHQVAATEKIAAGQEVPDHLVTMEAIRLDAAQRLTESMRQFDRANLPAYGIFPVVSAKLDEASQGLEADRLRSFAASAPLAIEADLGQIIEQSPTAHRKVSASLRLFQSSFLETQRRLVLDDYLAKARLSPVEAREVRPRLLGHLEKGTAAKSLKENLARWLSERLPKTRLHVAQAQIDRQFPAMKTWAPTAALIIERYDRGDEAKLDFGACCRLLGKENMLTSPVVRAALLEEAEQVVVDAVDQRIREGVEALRGQLLLLQVMEKERAEELQLQVGAQVTKESIVGKWTSDLTAQWRQRYQGQKYAELFPRTGKEIRKAVSTHFNSVRSRMDELKRQERPIGAVDPGGPPPGVSAPNEVGPPGSERPQGGGSLGVAGGAGSAMAPSGGGAGGGLNKGDIGLGGRAGEEFNGFPPDGVLFFADQENSGKCTVRFSKVVGGVPAQSSEACPFDPLEIDSSASKIVEAVWPRVLALLQEKAVATKKSATEPVTVRLHVSLASAAVRHRMSVIVRCGLEAKCRGWLDSRLRDAVKVQLRWSDGLESGSPASGNPSR